jgi:hypothetical protein
MGDFHPEAQVKGFSTFNITALISNSCFATIFSVDSIKKISIFAQR